MCDGLPSPSTANLDFICGRQLDNTTSLNENMNHAALREIGVEWFWEL